MTNADRFMRNSIKRRLSLTTLLQISKSMKSLTDREIEERFGQLNHLLETSRTEVEFCIKALDLREGSDLTENSGNSPGFFTEGNKNNIRVVRTVSSGRSLISKAG